MSGSSDGRSPKAVERQKIAWVEQGLSKPDREATKRIPRFVSRGEWGAEKAARESYEFFPQNGGITVHHEGGGHKMRGHHSLFNWPSAPNLPDNCYTQVLQIQHQHMHPLPWIGGDRYWDIAYNYLVCHHGYTFVGRGIGVQPGANGTHWANVNLYAVCGLLGADDEPTREMLDEIKAVCDWVRDNDDAGANLPGRTVVGHKDIIPGKTDCPGNLYQYVKDGRFE
ncbi:hypothetical protein ACFVYR_02715 [Streptomyces sp. NPDC058284]|uniref:hypothetical protein n=1 Tax=unclassified Streptomyces TaxID=2593676 RepID=UPI00365EF816